MSLIDDLAEGASRAGVALGEVARMGGTVATAFAGDARSAFNDWEENRRTEMKWNELDERMEKAAKELMSELDGDDHKPARPPIALDYDPFDLVSTQGFRERPSSFTYQSLEMIGRGVPVIADVIRVRTTQVQSFCQLPEDRHSPGLRVRLKDWRNTTMDGAAEKEAALLEQVVLNTGFMNPARPQDAISLKEFAEEIISDTLIYDQVNFEIIPDRAGRPSYIRVVDPSTIRLLDPNPKAKASDPYAVQVVDGAIVADFTKDELAFCIRHPRSGLRSYNYGLSEIETLVREITGFLWAMDYNRKVFTNGSATKGILNFKGTIPDKHLKSFRRQWYAMVAGIGNAWRTPITNAEELQWISMQLNNRDMEFSSWMDFLIKIVCARYLIAPEEVQFSYGNTGQSQAMGQAPIEEKLKASRDLGLRPLVMWFFEQLNRHLIERINPDFEVVPVGLDAEGQEAETELLKKQQEAFLTINEARERVELEPLEEDQGGNVIMNPTWLQYVQGKEAAAMGMDGEEHPDTDAEDFPDPDEDGWDDDEDDEAGDFDLDFNDDAPTPQAPVDSNNAPPVKKSERKVRYTLEL